LAYTFIETVTFMHIPYVTRAVGGLFFLSGMFIMAWNVWMTIRRAHQEQAAAAEAPVADADAARTA
ncbi:MAG: cytochrome C oxidase Cbb3, partial [Thiothrix sp.]|nr:cytochrome C oxidase Cbb3 [Thiothrix sp.]